MSIYCTGYTLRLPVDIACDPSEKTATAYRHGEALDGPGQSVRERWIEIVFQHVPNHINEENGYTDDWLPAFSHKPGCVRRVHYLTDIHGKPFPYTDCDCGDRCVFVLDEDHAEKIGQRYPEPLLVLNARDYERAPFDELLGMVSGALEARFGVHA